MGVLAAPSPSRRASESEPPQTGKESRRNVLSVRGLRLERKKEEEREAAAPQEGSLPASAELLHSRKHPVRHRPTRRAAHRARSSGARSKGVRRRTPEGATLAGRSAGVAGSCESLWRRNRVAIELSKRCGRRGSAWKDVKEANEDRVSFLALPHSRGSSAGTRDCTEQCYTTSQTQPHPLTRTRNSNGPPTPTLHLAPLATPAHDGKRPVQGAEGRRLGHRHPPPEEIVRGLRSSRFL